MILKGTKDDDLTLKYLLEQNKGSGGDSHEIDELKEDVEAIELKIGNTPLPTTHQSLTGAIAELDGDISGKVSKAGDTMTGALNMNDPDLSSGSAETVWGNTRVNLRDKNDELFGYLQAYTQNYRNGIQFTAFRDVGGNSITHGVLLSIDDSGGRHVYFHDANAWLAALGLTTSSTSTISDIITANSDNATITAASYAQWGKIASIFITWENKAAITVPASGNISNISVGTMVSGKRPAIAAGAWSQGDSGGAAWYTINTTGAITLRACEGTGSSRTIAKESTFYICSTFILP